MVYETGRMMMVTGTGMAWTVGWMGVLDCTEEIEGSVGR